MNRSKSYSDVDVEILDDPDFPLFAENPALSDVAAAFDHIRTEPAYLAVWDR